MRPTLALAAIAALALSGLPAAAAPVRIVAAESVYGDVAAQVAGPAAEISSIMTNPDTDPHLFEASPSIARDLSGAGIVVVNGIGYDAWMNSLLKATPNAKRRVIDVAKIAGRKDGDNPHLWYDPKIVLAYAATLADAVSADDPADSAAIHARLEAFRKSMAPLEDRIAMLRKTLAGEPVTATEPVFGLMFDDLGLVNRNATFQIAVMNDTEPGAADVAAFEEDLRKHRVKLLVTNSQASDPAADRLSAIAKKAGVPIVQVTETLPAGMSYQDWVSGELDAVARALAD